MHWPVCKSVGVHSELIMGSFVPVIYLSIALDRGWYQILLLHKFHMHQGLFIGITVHLYICLCVHGECPKHGIFVKLNFSCIYCRACNLYGGVWECV